MFEMRVHSSNLGGGSMNGSQWRWESLIVPVLAIIIDRGYCLLS